MINRGSGTQIVAEVLKLAQFVSHCGYSRKFGWEERSRLQICWRNLFQENPKSRRMKCLSMINSILPPEACFMPNE
jgi:hypothetical protein